MLCFRHDPPADSSWLLWSSEESAEMQKSFCFDRKSLSFLNQRYIAMAGCAGGNWHNLWTNLEDSNALQGSTTDAQSRQGGECFVFYALWAAYNVVAVKLLSIYQSWRIHGPRNDPVLDVEKCQQNHEACPPGSTNSSGQLLGGREKCWW